MLATTASTMLRPGAVRVTGIQPLILRHAASSFSTSLPTPLALRLRTACTQSPSFRGPSAPHFFSTATSSRLSSSPSLATRHSPLLTTRRAASSMPQSDAQIDATAAAAAAAQQSAAHPEQPPLDWNTFFKLRKSRRRLQLVFSAVTALGTAAGTALLLISGALDPVLGLVPLEQFITMGLVFFAALALGWLAGPSFANVIFGWYNRRWMPQMQLKENAFFARIKKHRVDPSGSSTSNPVPDFYGEKISSVAGYRQWLKDQRVFNKKRVTFV